MNIVHPSKSPPNLKFLLLIGSLSFLASCSKWYNLARDPYQFEITNCFQTTDPRLNENLFIESSDIRTLFEWWEIDSSSYFLLWNIQKDMQDTVNITNWLTTCIPEEIAVCEAFRNLLEKEWEKGYSPDDVVHWPEFYYNWIRYKIIGNDSIYSFQRGSSPFNEDGSYNTEVGELSLTDSLAALNQEIRMFVEWFEEGRYRQLPTGMIDGDEDLQSVLKKAWFERVVNNIINYPPGSNPSDYPPEYIRIKPTSPDGMSFQWPALETLQNLPWSASAYNNALQKLNKADEERRDDLLQRAKDMIDAYEKLIEEWCIYDMDIDLLSLQELEELIPRLEAITFDETQKEEEIETPVEDCFSITPQWQINSSCENVSWKLTISNTSWNIFWPYNFSGTFDVWLILSSQLFTTWIYFINIIAVATDSNTGHVEQRNQTLKYTKQ